MLIKLMHKILSVFLTIFLCLFMASCQNSSNASTKMPGKSIELSEDDEHKVFDLIGSLVESHIEYNFNSIKDIAPKNLCDFIGYCSGDLEDFEKATRIGYDPNYPLRGWVDKEQAVKILKAKFTDITDWPYNIENSTGKKDEFAISFEARSGSGNSFKSIAVTASGNLIYVLAECKYSSDFRETSEYSGMNLYFKQKMLYTFERQSDGTIKIKSGKVVYN